MIQMAKRCLKLTVFIDVEEDDHVRVDLHSEYLPVNPQYIGAVKEAIKQTTEALLSLILPKT